MRIWECWIGVLFFARDDDACSVMCVNLSKLNVSMCTLGYEGRC